MRSRTKAEPRRIFSDNSYLANRDLTPDNTRGMPDGLYGQFTFVETGYGLHPTRSRWIYKKNGIMYPFDAADDDQTLFNRLEKPLRNTEPEKRYSIISLIANIRNFYAGWMAKIMDKQKKGG